MAEIMGKFLREPFPLSCLVGKLGLWKGYSGNQFPRKTLTKKNFSGKFIAKELSLRKRVFRKLPPRNITKFFLKEFRTDLRDFYKGGPKE